jgi:hypothetical protein
MNKEFCTYEQALALKELGFDEPCMAIYYSKDKSFSWHHHKDHTNNEPALESSEFNISAPLYQQAFRWFREKYGLQNNIWSGKISTVFYGYDILNIKEQEYIINNSENGGGDCDYETHEEAELACLDKLIEIVKNK